MTKNQTEPRVVSQGEWIEARKDLLTKEKNFTRQRDALSAERRKLPWVRVEKEYVFDTPGGKEALASLFGGKSQLIGTTSCSVRDGRRVARAVRCWPIISTGALSTSPTAT